MTHAVVTHECFGGFTIRGCQFDLRVGIIDAHPLSAPKITSRASTAKPGPDVD
jgi:hypothetical protein